MNVFETNRLKVRRTTLNDSDVEALYRLWTDPEVMKQVGFPQGLQISREKVKSKVAGYAESAIGIPLIVENEQGDIIGHCQIGAVDDAGVSNFDIKFFPQYHGQGYGTELLRGLIPFAFQNTNADFVRGTPNKANQASIRMQERSGLSLVGEGLYEFPEHMRAYTCSVPYLTYQMSRKDWLAARL